MTEAMTAPSASVAGFPANTPGVTPPSNRDRQGLFLTDVIAELAFADQDVVQQAVDAARQSGKTPERCLLDSGAIDEHQLSVAFAERTGLDHIDLARFPLDPEAASLIGKHTAARYMALPIAFAPDGALIVAFEDPYDMLGISDIEVTAKCEVRPVVAARTQIQEQVEALPDRAPAAAAPRAEQALEVAEAFEVAEAPEAEPADSAAETESPPEPQPEPETEPEPPPQPQPEAETEPSETPPEPQPEPETESEPPPEPQPEPEPLQSVPPPGPASPDGDPGDLLAAIAALQDHARHAAALAEANEGRIRELEDLEAQALQATAELADQRAELERERRESAEREQALQRELATGQARIAEHERRLSEVAAAAESAMAASERLAALSSVPAAEHGDSDL